MCMLYFYAAILLLSTALSGVSAMDRQNDMTAQNATELALTYAYPLLSYRKAFSSLSPLIGINRFGHARQLATSSNRHVVKPNVDTLYSTAIFDISENDVVIKLPTIPEDQYALLSVHDLYGDNFAVIGKKDFVHKRPFHLSHQRNNTATCHKRISRVSDDAHISSPTTFGLIMIRWLVKESNLEVIHSLQNATSVQAFPKSTEKNVTEWSSNPSITSVNWLNSSLSPAENALGLLCEVGDQNRPKPIREDLTVEDVLEKAGICQSNIKLTDIDLDAANSSALAAAQIAGQEALQDLNNGWSAVQSDLTGSFGLNHRLRMEIASTGFLMLQEPHCVYPSWTNGSVSRPMEGQILSLGTDESYIYTFSGKPLLRELGFWSLTAYDSDGYLIENSRKVFSLGDRSNIKYHSGAPIYGSGSDIERDEPFQLLIQPANVTPPIDWIENWLPGPTGGGSLTTLLRWYNADVAMINGKYQYPVVTKQRALRSAA